MFSTEPRCQYQNNQLAEVICQIRFPEILSINVSQPAAFQEEVRSMFPVYSVHTENAPAKLSGNPGNLRLEQPPATNNHQFASEDGTWRINLTSKFISLSCTQYVNWEFFAKCLDTPLAAFIKIYRPAYFERIGLRYMNFISRKSLGLEGVPFCNLFQPSYLGVLGEPNMPEQNVLRCGLDTEVVLLDGCNAKIHAGPGMVTRNGQSDNEVHFIFDQDLYTTNKTPVNYAAETLQTLHAQAYPVFRGAITELLHNKMEPKNP